MDGTAATTPGGPVRWTASVATDEVHALAEGLLRDAPRRRTAPG